MDVYAGVDEAGRGCIVGPLVMAIVMCSPDDLPAGVKDSKALTKSKREELYEQLIHLPHRIEAVPASVIDTRVRNKELNLLELETTVELAKDIKAKHLVVDCPSTNTISYAEQIKAVFTCDTLVCVHKADRDYPVVAAASILAKVTRDRIIESLQQEVGVDFGSGYLTDPKTIAFLETADLEWKHLRKSWSTWTRLKAQREQKTLF